MRVSVIDAAPGGSFRGSTGHAPGYIGLYNETPILTKLAISSAAVYDEFAGAFRRVGGLEVALTENGASQLRERADGASACGLPTREVEFAEVERLAPGVVDPGTFLTAFHYSSDGVAEARELTDRFRTHAAVNGVDFYPGHIVTDVRRTANGLEVKAGGKVFPADDVILAGGIWGPSLARLLGEEFPLFPVAHPYVYSAVGPERLEGSFVRWPERHVYARVHGSRMGLGSYDHPTVSVSQREISSRPPSSRGRRASNPSSTTRSVCSRPRVGSPQTFASTGCSP